MISAVRVFSHGETYILFQSWLTTATLIAAVRTAAIVFPCLCPNMFVTLGVTNATELLWAQQEMLGLAPDLAAALVGLTAISSLDPTS